MFYSEINRKMALHLKAFNSLIRRAALRKIRMAPSIKCNAAKELYI